MFSLSALAANLMALGGETPQLREELTLVWQWTGMTDARSLGSHVIVMTHVNDNTWTWLMKNIVLAGDPLPDSSKSTPN